MGREEDSLMDAVRKEWGAIRGLLRHSGISDARRRLLLEKVERRIETVEQCLTKEEKKRLSPAIQQMHATVLDADDEPTLVPLPPLSATTS
jgi:hypothetical protein